MRRLVALAALAGGLAALAAAPAGATNECKGLQICVPITGPWVLTSAGAEVQYQLPCPKGFVVAGLDAELSTRGIEVGFRGALGSPVNPGITTTTAAVFLARLVRGTDPAASFRPHIGCIPAAGGGQRLPTAFHVYPPSRPTLPEMSEIPVHAGTHKYVKTLRRARAARERHPRGRVLHVHAADACAGRERRGEAVGEQRAHARVRARRPGRGRGARGRPGRPRLRGRTMTFGDPYLLLSLLAVPLAIVLWRLAERRRMRYAVRYTNVDVLASVAGGRQWRRYLPAGLFLVALATLCVGIARPHVKTLIAKDNATVVLVLDVSGSMQANDVKPTRLVAAQRAMNIFLDRVPSRLKVGLILFAGEADVAMPPTADHALVRQAIGDVGAFRGSAAPPSATRSPQRCSSG